jgi:hypothetical protein
LLSSFSPSLPHLFLSSRFSSCRTFFPWEREGGGLVGKRKTGEPNEGQTEMTMDGGIECVHSSPQRFSLLFLVSLSPLLHSTASKVCIFHETAK